jgi:hypothetical protein
VLIILIVGGPGGAAKLLTPLIVPLNLNSVEVEGFKVEVFLSNPLGACSKL